MTWTVLASESLGVRSFATWIQDARVLIDPSVALAPRRQKYPPHPRELQMLRERWEVIVQHLRRARTVVITHYHHDHQVPYLPLWLDREARVWMLDPRGLNARQQRRAAWLQEALERRGIPYTLVSCDEHHAEKGVWFSGPVPHGKDGAHGLVTMVGITAGGERLLYTSDIQGPTHPRHVEAIVKFHPTVLLLDLPPTYLRTHGHLPEEVWTHLEQVFTTCTELHTLVVDHHALRDPAWHQWWAALEARAATYG
ncbi:MAG: hypothetical protein L3J76_05740, partial [Candidatus Hydrothermae bacterium]|nr:hypothetical protein [Candidatus Hydrothermae bacterium]